MDFTSRSIPHTVWTVELLQALICAFHMQPASPSVVAPRPLLIINAWGFVFPRPGRFARENSTVVVQHTILSDNHIAQGSVASLVASELVTYEVSDLSR